MKTLQTVFTSLLLLTGSMSFAQIPSRSIQKMKAPKIATGSSLNWYNSVMVRTQNYSGTQNNARELVMNTRTEGSLKAEVGTNLTQASSVYTNTGAVKTMSFGNTTCLVQPKKINDLNTGNFSIFSLSSFDFYPGDFVRPELILNNVGGLTNYAAAQPRNPYNIGISIFANKPGPREITVTDFSKKPQAKIQDSLLRGNFGAGIPSKGILNVTEIKSLINLSSELNFSSGIFLPLEELGIPAEITAGLRLEGKNESNIDLHYYLVSFMQPLYTLNLLTNPERIFVNPAHSAANAGGAFVADVTYGRRAIFIFSATSEKKVLEAMFDGGLNASVTGGDAAGVEVGVKAGGNLSSDVKNSVITFWGLIYGGNGNNTLSNFDNLTGFNTAFKNYINSPDATVFSNRTNAEPLTYTLRSISTGSPIAVRSLGNFEEPMECSVSNYDVDINFEGFTMNKVAEWWGDDADDIFGTFKLADYKVGSDRAVRLNIPLFDKGDNSAISKKKGESYLAKESLQNVGKNFSKESLLATKLNFTETIKDWEAAIKPEYNPLNERDLQFDFNTAKTQIDRLNPGQSHTITKGIALYEGGKSDAAKITMNLKITVKRK